MDTATFYKCLNDFPTQENHRKFLVEANRRGYGYELFVEGYTREDGEGIKFIAKSIEDAIDSAYFHAWACSRRIDGFDFIYGPQYSTHAFKLFHHGRLIYEYSPPTPEEVVAGKVRLWHGRKE